MIINSLIWLDLGYCWQATVRYLIGKNFLMFCVRKRFNTRWKCYKIIIILHVYKHYVTFFIKSIIQVYHFKSFEKFNRNSYLYIANVIQDSCGSRTTQDTWKRKKLIKENYIFIIFFKNFVYVLKKLINAQ